MIHDKEKLPSIIDTYPTIQGALYKINELYRLEGVEYRAIKVGEYEWAIVRANHGAL